MMYRICKMTDNRFNSEGLQTINTISNSERNRESNV